jgi:uncharacterized protein involved in response to NO
MVTPVLRLGFRPFFFLAGLWAVLAMAAWIAMLSLDFSPPTAVPGSLWHAHEFLFGYGFAVIAGFLLTAIPNWTGRLPVSGAPLAMLAALWLVARAAMALGGWLDPLAAAILVLAFPAAFTLLVAREIFAGGNWRNLPILAALACLFLADGAFWLSLVTDAAYHDVALRLAVAVLAALITLVGGRVTPSFTRNWLVKQGSAKLPAPMDNLDKIAMAVTVAALAMWVSAPAAEVTGAALFAAAFALAARLSRWQGQRCWREPLVLILHLGYGWLPLGLALLGWSVFSAELAMSDALHGLTTGAVGTMTLAVMTRATLGHSNRPLSAGPASVAIYAFAILAGIGRVAAGFAPAAALALMQLSAIAWIAAFSLVVIAYGPLLVLRAK